MNKEELTQKVLAGIDGQRSLRFLRSLIRLPSESGSATLAQELVLQRMEEMGFEVDRFGGNTGNVQQYPDYCPLPEGETVDEGAYNLVGFRKGAGGAAKSLMLFSHIDTEPAEAAAGKRVYEGELKDGKLYGLGAADAKSGIATILLAAEAVLRQTNLNGSLTLMSVLGKRGGSAGTLSAIGRGYSADGGVYVHPAETGHGFTEIKNFSMGTIDFRVLVEGAEGVPRDELDSSEKNAVVMGSKVIDALIEWDEERRSRLLFEEGTYRGGAKTKLNIGQARGGTYVGKDPVTFELQCRLYFGDGESIESVLGDLRAHFAGRFENDPWLSAHQPFVEALSLRASPAFVEREAPITAAVRESIGRITGERKLIYQYHGASDIRLPILYGKTPTVGIGPKCGGLYGQEWADWVDVEDFIAGIKILAALIVDWCCE